MKESKIIKDFEMLLEKDFALPNSYIEEDDNGKYVYHGEGFDKYLTYTEAIEMLSKMKKNRNNNE